MKNFGPTPTCPIRQVLSRLGDKWSMLVLSTLHANGTMRFSALQQSIGDISHRMLTVTLRTLERDGMVLRHVYAEIPPRVEYTLTPRGESLMPHLYALITWSQEHTADILTARQQSLSSEGSEGSEDSEGCDAPTSE